MKVTLAGSTPACGQALRLVPEHICRCRPERRIWVELRWPEGDASCATKLIAFALFDQLTKQRRRLECTLDVIQANFSPSASLLLKLFTPIKLPESEMSGPPEFPGPLHGRLPESVANANVVQTVKLLRRVLRLRARAVPDP